MFEREESNLASLLVKLQTQQTEGSSIYFDVEEYELLVDHFMNQAEDAKAEWLNDLAIDQHPNNASFFVRKAQLFGLKGCFEEAYLALELAESLDGFNEEVYLTRANLLSRQHEHKESLEVLYDFYPRAEDKAEVALLVAYEYQALAEYEKALKWLKHALKLEPKDEIALYNCAFCFEMCALYHEAIDFFSSYLDSNPYSEIAWHQLGIFLEKMGNAKRALWAIDYAILIDEHFSAAYHEKARVLNGMKRHLQAAEALKETLKFEDPSGFVHLKIAECYKDAGIYKDALIHAIKATHYDPQLDEAWIERAMILESIGRPHEAIVHLKKALDLDPENPDYWYLSAQFFKRNAYLDEAEKAFQQLIELGCVEMEIWVEYTDLLLDLHESEQAIEALYSGIDHNPDSAELHYLAAGLLFSMDEELHGLDCLESALKLNYEKHSSLLDNFPDLKSKARVMHLISSYKTQSQNSNLS